MTEQEKAQLNNAKEIISVNGIPASLIETIDFNTLNSEKLRFAYVLSKPTYQDKAETDQLEWKFDANGHMKLMKPNEYDIDMYTHRIEITSLIDNPIVKINVIG